MLKPKNLTVVDNVVCSYPVVHGYGSFPLRHSKNNNCAIIRLEASNINNGFANVNLTTKSNNMRAIPFKV